MFCLDSFQDTLFQGLILYSNTHRLFFMKHLKLLQFFLPIAIILVLCLFRDYLAIFFQQIGWLSVSQFFESNTLANVLLIVLISVGVLDFLLLLEKENTKRQWIV